MTDEEKDVITYLHKRSYIVSTIKEIENSILYSSLLKRRFIMITEQYHMGPSTSAIFLAPPGMSIKRYYDNISRNPYRML